MSVKIARLRSGEDIISDIREVYNSDTERIAAIQIDNPYIVTIIEDSANMFADDEEPFKMSNPKIAFYPWAPLSSSNVLYLDPNEVICVYDPHSDIIEKYSKLLEAVNGRNGNAGDCGCGSTTGGSETDSPEGEGLLPSGEDN